MASYQGGIGFLHVDNPVKILIKEKVISDEMVPPPKINKFNKYNNLAIRGGDETVPPRGDETVPQPIYIFLYVPVLEVTRTVNNFSTT